MFATTLVLSTAVLADSSASLKDSAGTYSAIQGWCAEHCSSTDSTAEGCQAACSGLSPSHAPNSGPAVDCPLPTFDVKSGDYTCPNQMLNLAERRTRFSRMKPFDEINGVKLDDHWPATAGNTVPLAGNYQYDYNGVSYKGYRLSRPTGERAPVHYHEVAQLLCLEKGKIRVLTDGEPDKTYTAPDCYMMPAYTKVSVISLETKVENCLLRVPHGGYDWIVIEPKYYDLQGQWTANVDQKTASTKSSSLGLAAPVSTTDARLCPANKCPMKTQDGSVFCAEAGMPVHASNTLPSPTRCSEGVNLVMCQLVSSGVYDWCCEGQTC